jgi:hypothetical protein
MKMWQGGVVTNDVGVDEDTGEFVLVTNGICVLPHTTADFKAGHETNGGHCCYKPYEGLVFETVAGAVKGWGIQEIASRRLVPAPADTAASIKTQMAEIMERMK